MNIVLSLVYLASICCCCFFHIFVVGGVATAAAAAYFHLLPVNGKAIHIFRWCVRVLYGMLCGSTEWETEWASKRKRMPFLMSWTNQYNVRMAYSRPLWHIYIHTILFFLISFLIFLLLLLLLPCRWIPPHSWDSVSVSRCNYYLFHFIIQFLYTVIFRLFFSVRPSSFAPHLADIIPFNRSLDAFLVAKNIWPTVCKCHLLYVTQNSEMHQKCHVLTDFDADFITSTARAKRKRYERNSLSEWYGWMVSCCWVDWLSATVVLCCALILTRLHGCISRLYKHTPNTNAHTHAKPAFYTEVLCSFIVHPSSPWSF